MRRLVAITLLLLFAVQSTWAVAAAYCGHESDATSSHVGHHDHDHRDPLSISAMTGDPADAGTFVNLADASAGDVSDPGPLATDADCSVCHGGMLGTGVLRDALTLPSMAETHGRPAPAALPAPPLQAPEEPDWQRLA